MKTLLKALNLARPDVCHLPFVSSCAFIAARLVYLQTPPRGATGELQRSETKPNPWKSQFSRREKSFSCCFSVFEPLP